MKLIKIPRDLTMNQYLIIEFFKGVQTPCIHLWYAFFFHQLTPGLNNTFHFSFDFTQCLVKALDKIKINKFNSSQNKNIIANKKICFQYLIMSYNKISVSKSHLF